MCLTLTETVLELEAHADLSPEAPEHGPDNQDTVSHSLSLSLVGFSVEHLIKLYG